MGKNDIGAVVDTNVLIDVFSAVDLLRAHSDGAAGDTDERFFRRLRARESLLLAWLFHSLGLRTLSLGSESSRILTRCADPTKLGDFGSQFVQVSIYFLKDYVLNRWNADADATTDLRGDDADQFLVDTAQRLGQPLISNEGYSLGRVDDSHGIRARARAAGVRVFTPRQFWRHRMSEGSAIRRLFARFDSQGLKFLQGQSRSVAATRALNERRAILRYVLLGEVKTGPAVPTREPEAP